MPEPSNRPRVLVCALGGTIAMTRGAEPGVVPTESAQSLVDAVPALAEAAEIEAMSFRQLPGAHLGVGDVVELARHLAGVVEQYDGIVVTQGTDTLEETAFVLDLLWQHDSPVVVTGAMRNPTVQGADGPANLLSAVAVAGAASARGRGCLVVLGDDVHAARFVQKRHTTRPSAFVSAAAGPIGIVSEGALRMWATPHRVTMPAPNASDLPHVALLTMSLGDDGRLFEAVAERGFAGLVVEAFGGGHVHARVAEMLGGLAGAMPVVLASRTGAGPLLEKTYGFPGSEIDLLGRGLVSAGSYDGLKARLMLTIGLANGYDRERIAALFED